MGARQRGSVVSAVTVSALLVLTAACSSSTPSSTPEPAETSAAESPDVSPEPEGSETPTEPGTDAGDLFPELSSLPTGPSEALVEAARAESGRLTTYLSFSPPEMEPVFEAFRAAYPFVDDIETVQLAAGEVSARILQESSAGAVTADYGETPANFLQPLVDQDMLLELDAAELGVPQEMMANDHMVIVSANLFGLVINTSLVPEGERPERWEDLLADEWSGGRLGMWANAGPLANLGGLWGEEQLLGYVEDLVAQDPVMISSPTATVQAVAAGEVAAAIGSHHQAQALADSGAPVLWLPLDAASVSVSQGYVPASAENPNTGKLFLAWLASDGYEVKEASTFRGVPNMPGTTADTLQGVRSAGWRSDESDRKAEFESKVEALLPRG